jgi:hypothetical protein
MGRADEPDVLDFNACATLVKPFWKDTSEEVASAG